MVASLSDGALQTIAQGPPGRRWILLEAPFDGLTEDFHEAADELRTRGFGVLLAHPERVAGIAADEYRALARELKHGTLLQVNSWSLAGAHGELVRALAAFRERLGGVSEATFITTAGDSSLDSCSQALAAQLDVPTLCSSMRSRSSSSCSARTRSCR
jgi:hypothetical protein